MAMLISRATGNFTAAATWGVADSATGSQLTNPSASTNTTTSYVYSSTFTGTNARVADGLALFLKRLNTTGTVTVALSDDNGVTPTREVTVNASDLPADESWVFFKFGTTLTLDGGTDYRVGVKASSADNALIYRDATAGNWGRLISTTLTGTPAATDTFLIVGEWTGVGSSNAITVTMNNTTVATDFGTAASNVALPTQTNPRTFNGMQIGQNGTLTWGTSSATNYYMRLSGLLNVWSGGTYNMGTSGTPCPRDSTMILRFDSSGQSATTSFGLSAFNGSTVSIYGQSRSSGKNVAWCLLSANAAANATTLTVDTDTGWLDNDEIIVSGTSNSPELDFALLNGNAGASTLTIDGGAGAGGGLAYSHLGTSPMQAEVSNYSRNVIIRNDNTNYCFVRTTNVSSFNAEWCRFVYAGGSNAPFLLSSSISSVNFRYCSFIDCFVQMQSLGTFDYCIFLQSTSSLFSFAMSVNPSTISNTVFSNVNAAGSSFQLANGAVLDGCRVTDSPGVGFNVSTVAGATATISNCVSHSNAAWALSFGPTTITPPSSLVNITNFKGWRSTVGITLGSTNVNVNSSEFWGNAEGIISNSTSSTIATFNNCKIGSDTTYTTTNGANITNVGQWVVNFNNCEFSPSTGIYAANTRDINVSFGTRPMLFLNNTKLGSATEVLSPANLGTTGFIKSSRHDQTEGAFKSWFGGGIVERDTTIFNTAAPSERLTPSSATIKLASGSRVVAVDDLGTVTINAYVRKSVVGDGAAYNGSQPRLILKANPACGINTDTVLATMSAAAGSWQQLTGTTAAVDADGALEFYVDCDGTAGWVNVDDWSVT